MKKKIEMAIVNMLTLMRVIGVFCIIPIFLKYGGLSAALISMCCYFTDMLDGLLARKLKVASFFGSMFDAVADKAFSIANLIILFTISNFSLIPIICELAIVIIQSVKFQKNINIQSSKAGKIKTWFIAITVIILYLVSDINKLTFLSSDFINSINNMNKDLFYGILYLPLLTLEVITLISYLTFKDIPSSNGNVNLPVINEKLKPGKTFKEKIDNFSTVWLNYDFYMKYKDCAGLKEIRKFVKNNR